MMVGGQDSFPLFNILNLPPKAVGMGSKNVPLSSTGNLVVWVTKTAPDRFLGLAEQAYYTPKAELLGVAEAIRRNGCMDFPPDKACVAMVESIVKEEFGLDMDAQPEGVVTTAYRQLLNLYDPFINWDAYRQTTNLGPFVVENETIWESGYGATPFLFDRDIGKQNS